MARLYSSFAAREYLRSLCFPTALLIQAMFREISKLPPWVLGIGTFAITLAIYIQKLGKRSCLGKNLCQIILGEILHDTHPCVLTPHCRPQFLNSAITVTRLQGLGSGFCATGPVMTSLPSTSMSPPTLASPPTN